MSKKFLSTLDLPLIILLIISLATFFFKLGSAALESYDEAWYGSISQNILNSGEWINLHYNGEKFNDHPPLAIWFMALSQSIFGENEFGVRFTSAVLGTFCIGLMYLIGKALFSKKSGMYSAIFLLSSLWFVLRARSGNLDVPLLFFFLLTTYLLVKKQFHWVIASLAATIMVKTLVGCSLIPLVGFVLVVHRKELHLKKMLIGTILAFLIVFPWYVYQLNSDSSFFTRHFLVIGLRASTKQSFSTDSLRTILLYLQSGIGKWFKPAIISPFAAMLIAILNKKYREKLFLLLAWFFLIATPFFLSSQTTIWQLLPIYPPLFLLLGFTIWFIEERVIRNLIPKFPSYAFPVLILLIAVIQYKNVMKIVLLPTNTFSSEKDIGLKLKNLEGNISLKSWFVPAAIYYSQKDVFPISLSPTAFQDIKNLSKDQQKDLFVFENEEKHMIKELGLQEVYLNISYSIGADYK